MYIAHLVVVDNVVELVKCWMYRLQVIQHIKCSVESQPCCSVFKHL